MAKRFPVYKGLQQPLVFRGFKGKFIYWGLGALLAGLVFGALSMALINMYFGAVVLIASIFGGLFFTATKQKNGLHAKTRNRGFYLQQSNLKKLRRYVRKTSV